MTAREGMSDLRERCVELREWHETGLLRDGKLRQLASSMTQFPADRRLTLAERQTEMEALNYVISTPAVFDMDSAVEAVARLLAADVCDPDNWGMSANGVRLKAWEVIRGKAKTLVTAALPHLMPDMEALRRELESLRASALADARDAERYRTGLETGLLRLNTADSEHVDRQNLKPWADEAIDGQRDTSEGGG